MSNWSFRKPASARAAAWKPAPRPDAAVARPKRTYRRAARRMRRRSRQVPAVAGAHERKPVRHDEADGYHPRTRDGADDCVGFQLLPARHTCGTDRARPRRNFDRTCSGACRARWLLRDSSDRASATPSTRSGGGACSPLPTWCFAVGLLLLSAASGPRLLIAAWIALGLGMGLGLYEAAFATLTRIYGSAARRPITGITLIAGFASTVGWPLTSWLDAHFGWRIACQIWAGIHIVLALPLNLALPRAANLVAEQAGDEAQVAGGQSESFQMAAVAYVFRGHRFCKLGDVRHHAGASGAIGRHALRGLVRRNADRAVAGRRANSRGRLANQISSVALGAIGDAHQSFWSGFARDRRTCILPALCRLLWGGQWDTHDRARDFAARAVRTTRVRAEGRNDLSACARGGSVRAARDRNDVRDHRGGGALDLRRSLAFGVCGPDATSGGVMA